MTKPLMLFCALSTVCTIAGGQVIVDHTCTDVTRIPQEWITQAKSELHIAYGHTSHGSQLISGMTGLVAFMNGKGYPTNLYAWNSGGTGGALELRDQPFTGADDLGAPDRSAWEAATRAYLDANPGVNVVIWSWCGQVSTATEAQIDSYLSLMDGLETDYPGLRFVYMTGHLDGSGLAGNLHVRNEQIRAYCRANGKTLYDFADIETYDPDGVYYGDKRPNDACDYDSDNNGDRDRNWALDWQAAHDVGVDWYACSSAHSQSLNANQKAYAAWWLWARLAGWPGADGVVCDSIAAQPHSPYVDTLEFTVSFSTDVRNFDDAADVEVFETGLASHTGVTVSGGPKTYTVSVLGVSGTGSVSIAVRTDSDVESLDGAPLASSITSAAVEVDYTTLPASGCFGGVLVLNVGILLLRRDRRA